MEFRWSDGVTRGSRASTLPSHTPTFATIGAKYFTDMKVYDVEGREALLSDKYYRGEEAGHGGMASAGASGSSSGSHGPFTRSYTVNSRLPMNGSSGRGSCSGSGSGGRHGFSPTAATGRYTAKASDALRPSTLPPPPPSSSAAAAASASSKPSQPPPPPRNGRTPYESREALLNEFRRQRQRADQLQAELSGMLPPGDTGSRSPGTRDATAADAAAAAATPGASTPTPPGPLGSQHHHHHYHHYHYGTAGAGRGTAAPVPAEPSRQQPPPPPPPTAAPPSSAQMGAAPSHVRPWTRAAIAQAPQTAYPHTSDTSARGRQQQQQQPPPPPPPPLAERGGASPSGPSQLPPPPPPLPSTAPSVSPMQSRGAPSLWPQQGAGDAEVSRYDYGAAAPMTRSSRSYSHVPPPPGIDDAGREAALNERRLDAAAGDRSTAAAGLAGPRHSWARSNLLPSEHRSEGPRSASGPSQSPSPSKPSTGAPAASRRVALEMMLKASGGAGRRGSAMGRIYSKWDPRVVQPTGPSSSGSALDNIHAPSSPVRASVPEEGSDDSDGSGDDVGALETLGDLNIKTRRRGVTAADRFHGDNLWTRPLPQWRPRTTSRRHTAMPGMRMGPVMAAALPPDGEEEKGGDDEEVEEDGSRYDLHAAGLYATDAAVPEGGNEDWDAVDNRLNAKYGGLIGRGSSNEAGEEGDVTGEGGEAGSGDEEGEDSEYEEYSDEETGVRMRRRKRRGSNHDPSSIMHRTIVPIHLTEHGLRIGDGTIDTGAEARQGRAVFRGMTRRSMIPSELRGKLVVPSNKMLFKYTLQTTVNKLCNTPMLKELSPDDAVRVIENCFLCQFRPKDILIRQGDRGNAMFILTEGEADVVVEDAAAGNRRFLIRRYPGEIVGEFGLVSDDPRKASVVARTRVQAVVMTRECVNTICAMYNGTPIHTVMRKIVEFAVASVKK